MVDLNLAKIFEIFKELGCAKLFVKILSENDNSKNQIYLASGFEALNIFPNLKIQEGPDESKNILYGLTPFYWVNESGERYQAPWTKLIFYPQYPEVRLSGFLRGCKMEDKPSALFNSENRVAGKILLLGIKETGETFAFATNRNTGLAKEIYNYFNEDESLLKEFLAFEGIKDDKKILLRKLKEIYEKNWVNGLKLDKEGIPRSYNARNGGGYTLEALLGIKPNGISEPDFMGWEVKQFGVKELASLRGPGRITLFTPEPTGGLYATAGVDKFIRKYGYPDKSGIADRFNFSSPHKFQIMNGNTNLTLKVIGYGDGKISDLKRGGVGLFDQRGNPAAFWNFSGLMTHWNRKHDKAVYVPSLSNKVSGGIKYKYGGKVFLGQRTDFLLFLKNFSDSLIDYDPGIKMENASTKPEIKRRSQFRIKFSDLQKLYFNWKQVDL